MLFFHEVNHGVLNVLCGLTKSENIFPRHERNNVMMRGSAVVFFSFGTKPRMFPSSAFANYNLTPARFISKFFREDISRNKLKLVYILRDRSKNIDSKRSSRIKDLSRKLLFCGLFYIV